MKTIIAVTAANVHRALSIQETDDQRAKMVQILEGESPSDPVLWFLVIYIKDGDSMCETYQRVPGAIIRMLESIEEFVQAVLGDSAPVDDPKEQNAPSTRRVQ